MSGASARPESGRDAGSGGDAGSGRNAGSGEDAGSHEVGEDSLPRDPAEVSVDELGGVGPARVERLAAMGIRSVRDLLLLQPTKLVMAGPRVTVREARGLIGERVTLAGKIGGVRIVRGGPRRSLVRVKLEDDTGSLDLLYFNQPWVRQRMVVGEPLEVEGQVVDARGPGLASPRSAGPDEALPAPGSLTPSYGAAKGLGQGLLVRWIAEARERFGRGLRDPFPPEALEERGLPDLRRACEDLHEPTSQERFDAAKRRLALESLVRLSTEARARRAASSKGRAVVFEMDERAHRARLARLPHTPTRGQEGVLADLRRDLARTRPMRRLLQGDVGTGKTLCGLYAALAAAEAGAQAALMAPTELLAEQHYLGARRLFEDAGLRTALFTGSLAGSDRRALGADLAAGRIDVVFGTHALFSASVRFARLGIAIVDEQHRFGVSQRRRLVEKGRDVHALLMTATPIPRSLALTLYGDFDVSILREAPPGRGGLTTRRVGAADRRRLAEFLGAKLEAGERVFWVCPRIETTESGRGAQEAFERISGGRFGKFGVELVHGRLDAADRGARLRRFREGESQLLVATTVIEVGVDVSEATAMVIEGVERFGLAQLHQLRGRVGRGARDAHCFLIGKASADARMRVLERTRDGFELAEEDLRQRGMGDLLGVRQAGANLEGLRGYEEDIDLLVLARELVASKSAQKSSPAS